jgi:hypothetical protein
LSVLDALEATKWAFIWAGYCVDDEVADRWVGYFRNMVRLRPESLDDIKSFYDAASWRLALEMRGGTPFDAATKAIVADGSFRDDYEATITKPRHSTGSWASREHYQAGPARRELHRSLPRSRAERDQGRRPPGRSRSVTRRDDRRRATTSSASGNGARGAGQDDRRDARGKSPRREVCRDFNRGLCNGSCGRQHLCSLCQGHHAATECERRDNGRQR